MGEGTANGFVVPPPQLSPGFEYQPAFDELLEQISSTNVVDADWPILRDMIKYKLAKAIENFLDLGPPYPLAPEEAYHTRSRAYETIDYFTGPPFTIQRLCELLLYPRTCYKSLPKYLRAVNRVLSVTSEQSVFTEDSSSDPLLAAAVASTSAETLESHSLGIVHDDKVHSPAHHTHRRSTTPTLIPSLSSPSASSSSPKSTPQVIPLLSPIPWLSSSSSSSSKKSSPVPTSAFDDDDPPSSSSSPSRNSLTTLPIETTRPSHPLHNGSPPKIPETATPTGGLVDEVDPGSGGLEAAEPIALSSTTTNLPPTTTTTTSSNGSPDSKEDEKTLQQHKGMSPNDLMMIKEEKPEDSLRSRFVRASSPKVKEEEEEEGSSIEERMKEGD
ncbi:uncharacterized protein JCM6883_005457 [Sporobolomyces salmoneus]|uniref:uncharacterized protein n=1 Tax=Sporobolomyces salmoneus TaxID=183962 RepID=UPI003173A4E4